MAICPLCGKKVDVSKSNATILDGKVIHKKCPKDKMSQQDSAEYKSLKDKITYHCSRNARGYIAENGMNFMRALQVVKQLHEKYSYREIEYALDKTVVQLGGFWGINQVANRIDVIIAKKRDMEEKMLLYKDKVKPQEAVDLRNLVQDGWVDEW